ncbi:hypothetical protein PsorP6_016833 [Peronosclerospora sorghi]|uniref:Uncharacterized protein n=1 Tax=Peronosclerospora sorghi TaxID=230839 RepID=A0ACC0WFW0_9STRA|nr:hypothetical protein PsorP6_016833 [Peronosclerospora sorghi]
MTSTSTMRSDEKATTDEKHAEHIGEAGPTGSEPACDVETKRTTDVESTTVGESTTRDETHGIDTVDEQHPFVHETGVTLETVASISAEVMDDIAETIAATQCSNVSVAATLGSSVDGASVKTEDFAVDDVFVEESRKAVDMDLPAPAREQVETATIEGGNHVFSDRTTTETKELEIAPTQHVDESCKEEEGAEMGTEIAAISGADTMSEMGYSVAATVGSSVDADSVTSLEDMIEACNHNSALKAGEETSLVHSEASDNTDASIPVQTADSDIETAAPVVDECTALVDTISEGGSTIETISQQDSAVETTEIAAGQSNESVATLEGVAASTEPGVELVNTTPVDAMSKVGSPLETALDSEVSTEATREFEHNNAVAIEASTELASEEKSVVNTIEIDTSSEAEVTVETFSPEASDITTTSNKLTGELYASGAASAPPNAEVDDPELEAENVTKTPKKFSSMLSRFAGKISKSGAHQTDAAATIELSSDVAAADNVEDHESANSSDTMMYRSDSSPVKNVVDRFEGHEHEVNSLESLKIRTKRDFFSEKERSISVSHEKEKYDTQMSQQAKNEAEAKNTKSPAKKQSFALRTSSAMSSVRNMASRFEKKADQSLDNLSFRTVRSFFPTEKSIDVSAEKHKYEALEKDKESDTSIETRDSVTEFPMAESGASTKASMDAHARRHTVTDSESSNVRGIAHRFETKRANSVVTAPVRTIDTFIVADSEASVRVSAEKAKYENPMKTSAPTKRTIDTFIVPKSQASVRVSAEKAKFETPEKQVKVTKRTIDTFIVPKEEASVRVLAEKAKFEMPEKQVKTTVRTIDTFIVPENEASVRVSAEKAKFEMPEKQVKTTVRTIDTFIVPENEASVRVSAEKTKFEKPETLVKAAVRTIDTFIVPENEVSVRVSAEKAKFESPEKLVKATVRTIDTFIVPENEASVRVSVEKAKFESLEQQMQAAGPAVRTIDTFIVPESEVSIRVAAEKAKLEALEKQKQSEMEAQAAIERQKQERAQLLASERAKLDEGSQTASDGDQVEDVEGPNETTRRTGESIAGSNATEVAQHTHVVAGAESVLEKSEVALETEEALKTENSTQIAPGSSEVASECIVEETEVTKITDEEKTEAIETMEGEVISTTVEVLTEEVEEVTEVTETEEVSKVVEERKVVEETVSKEVQEAAIAPDSTGSEVEVTVERQTFGDVVSTAQHLHWLSLPVSVNPALARLHTVLSDHDPLTAYALYPTSPPRPDRQKASSRANLQAPESTASQESDKQAASA